MNERLSAKLRGVSFLCAILIVLLHAGISGRYDHDNIFVFHVIRFLSYGISKAAVPLFFFISGFLFAYQYDNGKTFGVMMKRRLNSLGKPYIYWSLIYVLKLALFTIAVNHLSGRALNAGTDFVLPLFSLRNLVLILGLDLTAFPIYFPLWYVRNLFLLFLVFLPLQKLLKKQLAGGIFLFLIAVCCILRSFEFISGPYRQIVETGFSLNGLLCFSAGIYFNNFHVESKKNLSAAVILCVIWLVLAWPWKFSPSINFALNNLSVLVGSAAFWLIYDHLPGREKLESLPCLHYSFFIYVSHYIIMSILFGRKVYNWFGRMIHDGGLLFYVMQFIVTMIIVMVSAYVLERFVPKLYRALTGGR